MSQSRRGRQSFGAEPGAAEETILVGKIGAAYGVRGWVHLHIDLEPAEALLELDEWLVGRDDDWYLVTIAERRRHRGGWVVRFDDAADRDTARELAGLDIALPAALLPAPLEDEFYWSALIGCSVRNTDGVDFGRVTSLMETGANDVLVVTGERERLIPFVLREVVTLVDVDQERIVVDWHPDD